MVKYIMELCMEVIMKLNDRIHHEVIECMKTERERVQKANLEFKETIKTISNIISSVDEYTFWSLSSFDFSMVEWVVYIKAMEIIYNKRLMNICESGLGTQTSVYKNLELRDNELRAELGNKRKWAYNIAREKRDHTINDCT